MTVMLKVEGVSLHYGPIQALENVSVQINTGEVVAMLGANGAGKTSLLRAISGLTTAGRGSITMQGQDLTSRKASAIVRQGIAHCPEGRHIFPELTVAENLDLGAYILNDDAAREGDLERVFHYFPVLAERKAQQGGTLSGGEQQMLAVGRALMSSPKLLMLDEPSLGLAPMIIDQIFDIVRLINKKEGVTVFLVEQNANEALLHADRAYVLENGKITLDGTAEALRKDQRVIDAYLGV